jgi:hypothetical protein
MYNSSFCMPTVGSVANTVRKIKADVPCDDGAPERVVWSSLLFPELEPVMNGVCPGERAISLTAGGLALKEGRKSQN